MKVMIKIDNVSKDIVLQNLFMGVEYKQRGNDTFVWYYSKAIAKEDLAIALATYHFNPTYHFYKGWENEDFITIKW